MTAVAPFAFEYDGRVLVCGDGPELYVFSGSNDTPLWKKFCDGILVGVGAAGHSVVSVDTDGRVHWWRALDGEQQAELLLDMPARGVVVGRNGDVLVLVDGGVVIGTQRGEFRKVDLDGAATMAIATDCQTAVVGCSTGRLALLELASATVLATVDFEGAITSVTWSPKEHWLAVVGNQIHTVAKELVVKTKEGEPAKSPILGAMIVQGAPTMVTVSFDGVLLACDDGAQTVNVYELHENRIGCSIAYDRTLCGLAFGPGTMLGIGLEYGDANRVDAMSGAITHTQAGLGRTSDPWYPKVTVDTVMLRGAVAAARAGGKPIAEIVIYGTDSNRSCLIMVGVAVGLMVLFCCCSGVASGLYWKMFM